MFPLKLAGLTPVLAKDGSVNLVDAAGVTRESIPPGYAQDAKIDPVSGSPATTYAVTYALTTVAGAPALRVSLDPKWLADPVRVFPVTVDPTFRDTPASTYAEADNPVGDHSMETSVKVGSFNAEPSASTTFLQFPKDIDGSGVTVTAATLQLFDSWASTCTPEQFDVALVTAPWTPMSVTSYPGPAKGASVGNLTPNVPTACANRAADRTVGNWVNVALTTASIQGWVNGTTVDNGLAVYAATTDNLHWKQFDSANQYGYAPSLMLTTTGNVAPQVDTTYPGNAGVATSLTPALVATGHDIDASPNAAVQFYFQIFDATGTKLADSGLVPSGNWAVPAGKLKYGQTYHWTVQTYDGGLYSPPQPSNSLSIQVPQPPITSSLSQNSGLHGTDPSIGNYTTSETDADVPTAGPSLALVRDYNSRDPRTAGGFGAGWSSLIDARAVEQYDGAGAVSSVVITYPAGTEVGYGRNADGTFSPPTGRFATLKPVTGGYTLTDKNDTPYTFTQGLGAGTFGVSSVTDANGRAETLTWAAGRITAITSAVSGRKLTLTWTTPSGASSAHVATVVTDPSVAGQPATALTWTYSYTADQLTSVCPPGTTTACTRYTYTTGSQYRTLSLDQNPRSFWALSETGGGAAASAVLANAGADTATYSGVTLGQPGALAGSSATAAGFNGTNSLVTLPHNLLSGMNTESLSLWFKTSTANGVLFSYSALPLTYASTTGFYDPGLYVGSDGKLLGKLWQGSGVMTSPAAVTDGTWHHVVLSASGSSQTMWLDGTQIGTLAGTISVFGPQNSYYLGGGYIGGSWPDEPYASTTSTVGKPMYFTGSIADVGFYTTALTQPAVTALYTTGTHAANLLSSVVRPSGNTHAAITYDPGSAAVTQLTDENGGVWKLAAPTVSGSSQIYRAAVLGSGPSGYFRLGDTAGAATASDEINAGLSTYTNVGLGVPGPFTDQPGASFNGTSSSLAPPGVDRLSSAGPNTVEMWFKSAAAGGPGGILFSTGTSPIDQVNPSGAAMPVLYVGADGKLYGQFWIGSVAPIVSAGKVNDAAWHHVVLAGAGSSQTLFLDGNTVGTRTGGIANLDPVNFVGAGLFNTNAWVSKPAASWSHFTGSIAEVAIYKTQLTQADAATHFLAARNSQGLSPLTTVAITDPGNAILTDTYDPLRGDRPVATVNALGKKTTYGYDTAGFVHTVGDPNGNVVTTGHDVRGNTVSQTTCQNLATNACSTSYLSYYPDDTSPQLTTPDPRNDLVLTSRDARSASATDPAFQTSYGYDAAGNRTAVTTPPVPGFAAGRTTAVVYSDGTATYPAADTGNAPPGMPVKITSPGGAVETLAYLHSGDVATTTDADGLLTRYAYDGLGRLASRTVVSDTFPAGLATTYAYDGSGNVTSQTDPPVTDRVTGAIHTAVTTSTYDADGVLSSQTVADASGGDAARTVSSTVNAKGLPTSTVDGAGNTTSFTYDAYGNKLTETDPQGTVTSYTYDAAGHLLTQSISYTGSPVAPQTAAPLVEQSRAYDPAGRLASVTDSMGATTSYTYFGNDLQATVTRADPTGTTTFVEESDTYDGAGNPVSQTTNNGATVAQSTLDAAGRATKTVQDPAGVNRTTTISDSPDDQPTSTTQSDPSGSARTTTSTYDPMGNQTSQTLAGTGGGTPVGWWSLAQTSGTAVPDGSGTGNNATATGVTWTGGAASFPGTSGQGIKTSGPVLDTTGTFSVSAWAQLGNKNGFAAVASQDAAQTSGFSLQYDPVFDTWSFERSTTDVANPTPVRVTGTSAATTGVWTHLVAVFDSATNTMSLYVNGTLAGTTTDPTPIASNGPFAIGAGRSGAAESSLFPGSIDNVQAYSRVLSGADVTALYGAGRSGAPAAAAPITVSRTLDKRGLPTLVTDPNGNATSLAYDEAGQPAVGTEPTVAVETGGGAPASVHPVTSTGYNTFGEPVEAQDANGNTTVTAYDAAGRPVSERKPSYTPPGTSTPITPVTVLAYDHNGQLSSESDALNHTTSYTYDQLGDRVQSVDPAGGTTTSTFDTAGDTLSVTDATGARTQATYDFLGRKITSSELERYPSTVTATTSYSYTAGPGNPCGAWLASSTSPTGVITRHSANALGEQVSATDGAGNVTALGYDFLGRPTTTTLADGTSTAISYDTAGNKVRSQRKASDGTVLAQTSAIYDAAGNALSFTDPRGTAITLTHDASGAITQQVQPVTATSAITTSFGHDAAGNRTRFTDGRGNPLTYTYNTWNRQETSVQPTTTAYTAAADRTITTSYDAVGRPVGQTLPGGVTISAAYDTVGNLTSQSGAGADAATGTRSFGYDAVGRMISANTDAAGAQGVTAESFTYNDRGRLLTASGSGGASSFGYNPDGAMTTRTDASGTNTFGYDTAGRVSTVTDSTTNTAAGYTYNPLNQVTRIGYGASGDARTYAYDGLHRLTGDTLKTSGGAAVASITYGYDANDNMTSKTTAGFTGAASNTYTYDLANRLGSWNNSVATTTYGYDAAGNRTSVGSKTFVYDARNQLISDGASSYTYSARGTVTSQITGTTTATSTSDAFGQMRTHNG